MPLTHTFRKRVKWCRDEFCKENISRKQFSPDEPIFLWKSRFYCTVEFAVKPQMQRLYHPCLRGKLHSRSLWLSPTGWVCANVFNNCGYHRLDHVTGFWRTCWYWGFLYWWYCHANTLKGWPKAAGSRHGANHDWPRIFKKLLFLISS